MCFDLDGATKIAKLQSFQLLSQEYICSLHNINLYDTKRLIQKNLDVSMDDPVFMKASNCFKKLPCVTPNSAEWDVSDHFDNISTRCDAYMYVILSKDEKEFKLGQLPHKHSTKFWLVSEMG